VVSKVVDAIEVWVHAVLYKMKVYPERSFRKHVRMGTLVWMCDIQEVHDYVSEVTSSMKGPLLNDMLTSVSLLGFVRGKLAGQAVLEFPVDLAKEAFEAITDNTSSELEVGRFVDCHFKKIVDSIYASPSFTNLHASDWRVIAETKGCRERSDLHVENLFFVDSDGVSALEQAGVGGRLHPIKSVTLGSSSTAWLACFVEQFP